MKAVYFFILLFCVNNTVCSQWSTAPNENVEVAVHGGNIHVSPDGDGGFIITFNNFDYEEVTSYLHWVDKYGYIKWNEPIVIADSPGTQNYPNPFNPTTKIKYMLPNVRTRHAVSLQIYDVLGS